MIVFRDAGERGPRLPLPTRRDDEDVAARQAHDRVEIDRVGKIGQIAVVLRDRQHPVERPAGDHHLAPGFARDRAERVQARDIAGERGDQHPLARVAPDLFQKPGIDRAFRSAGVRIEDIGAFAHERGHAFVPDRPQFLFGLRLSDDGIFVQLPVAGMEDASVRRVDQQSVAFGDGVRQRHVATGERPQFERFVAFFHHVQFDVPQEIRLFQLAADQFGGERRGIDRHAQFGGEIRHRADVILVPVGQNDRFELVEPGFDEIEIGKDQIDAGILSAGKGHAQIDHQPPAPAAVEVDVHSDFAGPAQGKKQQFVFGFEIFLHAMARSASMARPFRVSSLSTASNRSVCSSNRTARPPVATTVTGRPISFFMRATSPSIIAT